MKKIELCGLLSESPSSSSFLEDLAKPKKKGKPMGHAKEGQKHQEEHHSEMEKHHTKMAVHHEKMAGLHGDMKEMMKSTEGAKKVKK